jgi:hypothetical protein
MTVLSYDKTVGGHSLMIQQQQTSTSGKIITYRIAKWVWLITTWIWTTIIIAFLVQFIPNLLTAENPGKTLGTIWTAQAIRWLGTSSGNPTQEALRLLALFFAFLLVILPPLAFFLKQMLQNVQREGFDKLIDILDQDTISPQLENLSRQLWQQHLEQSDVLTNGLAHINPSLIISHLSRLSTLLQQQSDLQKRSFQILQTMQTTLQQSTISTQSQRLDDLHGQEQKIQQVISNDLPQITSSLQQIRDQLSTIILLNQRTDSTQSSLATTDPNMIALDPPSQSNRHRHMRTNSTSDPNTASLAD